MNIDFWKLGDVVSRDGSDEHVVTWMSEGRDLMEFTCVKAPTSGWIQVGESEQNIPWRYRWLRTRADSTPAG
jgi:hypothetical protein